MIEQITHTPFLSIVDNCCTEKLIALNRRKSLLQWMVVCSIFMSLYIEITVLFCVNIYSFFVLKERFSVNWKLAVFYGISAMISFISMLWEGYPFYKFFQQLLLLSFFLMFEWNFFSNNRYFINELFQKYIIVCIILSCGGILQATIYHFYGVNIFSFMQDAEVALRNGKRISSFTMMEAGQLGNMLLVAYCYYLFQSKIKEEILKKFLLLISIFLTHAAVAIFFVCFFSCLRLFYDWKKKKFYTIRLVLVSIFFVVHFSIFFSYVKNNTWNPISERPLCMLHDVFNLWDDFSIENIESQNLSVYALMKNLWIALYTPNRLLGTGLGTHEINHDQVYLPVAGQQELPDLNREDAYSMAIRIFSEFGYAGIIVVLLYFINYFHFDSNESIAVLSILLALLSRGGHYTIHGTIFFIMLFYFIHLANIKNNLRNAQF